MLISDRRYLPDPHPSYTGDSPIPLWRNLSGPTTKRRELTLSALIKKLQLLQKVQKLT